MYDSVTMVYPPMAFDSEPDSRLHAHDRSIEFGHHAHVYGADPQRHDYDAER